MLTLYIPLPHSVGRLSSIPAWVMVSPAPLFVSMLQTTFWFDLDRWDLTYRIREHILTGTHAYLVLDDDMPERAGRLHSQFILLTPFPFHPPPVTPAWTYALLITLCISPSCGLCVERCFFRMPFDFYARMPLLGRCLLPLCPSPLCDVLPIRFLQPTWRFGFLLTRSTGLPAGLPVPVPFDRSSACRAPFYLRAALSYYRCATALRCCMNTAPLPRRLALYIHAVAVCWCRPIYPPYHTILIVPLGSSLPPVLLPFLPSTTHTLGLPFIWECHTPTTVRHYLSYISDSIPALYHYLDIFTAVRRFWTHHCYRALLYTRLRRAFVWRISPHGCAVYHIFTYPPYRVPLICRLPSSTFVCQIDCLMYAARAFRPYQRRDRAVPLTAAVGDTVRLSTSRDLLTAVIVLHSFMISLAVLYLLLQTTRLRCWLYLDTTAAVIPFMTTHCCRLTFVCLCRYTTCAARSRRRCLPVFSLPMVSRRVWHMPRRYLRHAAPLVLATPVAALLPPAVYRAAPTLVCYGTIPG